MSTTTLPTSVRSWIFLILIRLATSGGKRLNFLTALSGSGSANPIGVDRTTPTSLACSSLRSSLEMSSRSSGEMESTGRRTWLSSIACSPWSSEPPPVNKTRATGIRPGSDAKYWIELRISPTSSVMVA